ncbi:GNA1162 family protein [uncultured Bacteroides sp.]|jgi:putative lipoprotein|uniref:GNA1162 family protein n=1 Tax=uncultured Bacteroides sp. TaxID=162156 RepID=UPI00280C1E91|nr:GNA1162 family protein [uncultured Bacteroides sp.]
MKKIILFTIIAIALASCSTPKTLGEQYAAMYEEKPLTIAVMPPINQTTHAEAKDYFYTTMYMPLCEKGYYVYSPYLTMEMFQQESAYDAERFLESDLSVFKNVLNADAAMFTIIKDWRRNNVGGTLTVNIEYILRSTKTGQTLYQREGKIKVDTSVNGGGGGFGALVGMIATAINTAATDKVIAGRKCNAFVLSDLPAGKYSNMYEKDAKNPAGKPVIKATVK